MTNFNTLGISREILFNLNNLKLTNPTPIQKKAIIPALEGKDILDEIIREKKSVVFISGHFNNFELMALCLEKAGIDLAKKLFDNLK